MASVGQVKRNLHDGFPWLYENLGRIYRMTPYGKYRKARRNAEIARTNDHLQKDLQKKIQIRFEYELRIVREHLDNDWTVRHGPFSGMKLTPVLPNSFLSPKVIGSYESPIHQWVNDAIAYDYDRILDVGCAEGYYAVGFALKSLKSTIYAYDIDERSQKNTAALAALNGVVEKVQVRGLCTSDEFNREVSNRTLIFCDIEGSEFDLLFPDLASTLLQADLIVETHEDYRPGTIEALVSRFLPTHRIEIVYHGAKNAAEFAVLKTVPATEHALLLDEARPRTQCWMRLLAKRPGAIEPLAKWGWVNEIPIESCSAPPESNYELRL